jgi:hypothetical protein
MSDLIATLFLELQCLESGRLGAEPSLRSLPHVVYGDWDQLDTIPFDSTDLPEYKYTRELVHYMHFFLN